MMLSVDDFLTLQRQRLEDDKRNLIAHIREFVAKYDAQNAQPSADSQDQTKEKSQKNSGEIAFASSAQCSPRHVSSMIEANKEISGLYFKDDEPIGLPIGMHEQRRKKLAEERKADYNHFLIEKEKQLYQKKEAIAQRRNTISEVSTPRSMASMNYQDILKRKKEEEKQYRNLNHLDPVMDDTELLRLQNETDKLKSERDDLTMLISNLKRFADANSNASMSQPQFSQSVPPVGARATSMLNDPNLFSVAPAVPSPAAPSSAPTAFSSFQDGRNGYQSMLNGVNFNQSFPLPHQVSERTQNLGYQMQLQPHDFPPSTSVQNPLAGNMVPQHPKANQYLSNSDYIKELNEQVKQKQHQKRKDTEEENRNNLPTDFFPWGNMTGGGGAPMRDAYGNINTSRKGKSIPVLLPDIPHNLGGPSENNASAAPSLITKSFLNYSPEQETQRQHDKYKEDLRKQIEDNKRFSQVEKEKQRLEEEKLAQRIEEQRLRMQREYEEEQAKRIRKAEELRLKQERLMQLQEEQRKEEDMRKREAAEKRERERLEKLREQEEMRRNSIESQPRSNSPPVPTVRTQALDREKTSKDPRQNVLSQLTQLRQQLQEEQQKMNAKLKEQKKKYKVMDRRAVQEDSDDDDENEVNRLRRNSGKSRESSADSRGYTQRSNKWNKENMKYSGNDYSDVQVESLE